jgi:outer membrane protein assembly factor BamB
MRALFFLALSSSLAAADWPQFLGPQRDGVAAAEEPALPDSLPDTEPLWTHAVGEGHAGPIVIGDKVVIHHRSGSEEIAEALSAKDGTVLWRQTWPATYRDGFGFDNGPRAVPAALGGKLVLHGADGMVRALDLAKGELLWEVDTAKEFESPQGFFGRACAPLITTDGKVILTPGGQAAVAALDLATGKTLWATAGDEASYASPVLATPTTLLCWLRNRLSTLSLADGKMLAQEHYRPEIEASVSAATPIQAGSGWFITAEYDVGSSLWELGQNGSLTKAWQEESLLNAHYATPVALGQTVFGFDGRQERGMTLRAIDITQRKVLWNSPQTPGGTVLRVKDKLLVLTEDGELWLVKATPEKFEQLATQQILSAGHRSYAAYSGGVYYARDGKRLVAVRVRE